jgi:hypothetical protein
MYLPVVVLISIKGVCNVMYLPVVVLISIKGVCNVMVYNYLSVVSSFTRGLSWLLSYDSWIYNYLCNQCHLSPLMLWVRILLIGVLDTTLCNKVCQWLAAGWWFSLGTAISSTNKTDFHKKIFYCSINDCFTVKNRERKENRNRIPIGNMIDFFMKFYTGTMYNPILINFDQLM